MHVCILFLSHINWMAFAKHDTNVHRTDGAWNCPGRMVIPALTFLQLSAITTLGRRSLYSMAVSNSLSEVTQLQAIYK